MSDFYRPLKYEQDIDGTELDYLPTEADESEDIPLVKGVAVEDKNTLVKKVDGELAFEDGVSGEKKLSELIGSGGVTKEWVIAITTALG